MYTTLQRYPIARVTRAPIWCVTQCWWIIIFKILNVFTHYYLFFSIGCFSPLTSLCIPRNTSDGSKRQRICSESHWLTIDAFSRVAGHARGQNKVSAACPRNVRSNAFVMWQWLEMFAVTSSRTDTHVHWCNVRGQRTWTLFWSAAVSEACQWVSKNCPWQVCGSSRALLQTLHPE